MAKKRLRHHLKDHLLPHEGNGFRPLIFTAGGVTAVLVLVFLVQAAYLFQTRVVFKETNFLASVLPGVLATLANEDRAEAGVPTLVEDAHLARAAQMKAEDMAAKGYFSHVDPEGRSPWYWFDKAGYEYAYAGENLAVNFTDSKDVQEAWMNSPTHHANIVKTEYSRIGIGVAQGEYKGKDTTFVVQFFATPKTAAVAAPSEKREAPEEEAPSVLAESEEEPAESQVLGVEIGTVMPEAPDEEPVLETEYQAQQEEERAVAAAEPALSFFAQVAASPTHTLIYVLSALAAVFALLLIAAIFMHIRVQYLEIIGGGLLILLVIVSLLVANATNGSRATVPETDAPGAATEAL